MVMSTYSGRQGKGAARYRKEEKRKQAEIRNAGAQPVIDALVAYFASYMRDDGEWASSMDVQRDDGILSTVDYDYNTDGTL